MNGRQPLQFHEEWSNLENKFYEKSKKKLLILSEEIWEALLQPGKSSPVSLWSFSGEGGVGMQFFSVVFGRTRAIIV